MPRISAIDQALIAQAKRNADRVTIISVGVSQYSYLAPLPGVTQDLRLMRDIFVNKRQQAVYSPKRFIELANPNINEVRETIAQYAHNRSVPGDILILYFSGHGCVIGASSFGLCMSDTMTGYTKQILALSVLNFSEVVRTLSAAEVSPIFIIDACFSGLAASRYFPGVDAMMQEQIQSQVAGSYGLLCSSNMDSESFVDTKGSPFTNALYSIVMEGLADRQQRHSPFLTLRNISAAINSRLEAEGLPRPRCYPGPDLPEIPLARNKGFRPNIEKFSPYMRRAIEFLWNNGKPIEPTHHDLDDAVGKGSYGNHRKLSLAPWGLLENGARKNTRKLTDRGIEFAKGKLRIPETIIKDSTGENWISEPGTRRIRITDVSKSRRKRNTSQRSRTHHPRRQQHGIQLRLLKR